jgi:hypothetical protein
VDGSRGEHRPEIQVNTQDASSNLNPKPALPSRGNSFGERRLSQGSNDLTLASMVMNRANAAAAVSLFFVILVIFGYLVFFGFFLLFPYGQFD